MNPLIEELKISYETVIKNKKIPFITIDSNQKDLVIPLHLKNTDDVTFNISNDAVKELMFTDKYLEFLGTFNGTVSSCSIPYDAIICLIEAD